MSPHLSSRHVIIGGFSGVAVFMLAVLGTGLARLGEINAQMDELAHRTFRRVEALYTMRIVARDRLVSLQSMYFIADPFERDAERLRYGAMAVRFIEARDTLLGLAPSESQRAAWEEARRLIRRDEELHEQALEAIFGERHREAARLIQQQILPLEAELLGVLGRMLELERAQMEQRLSGANERYRQTLLLLVLLTAATFGVMVVTAVYVVGRASRNEELLREARRKAEEAAQKLAWAASHDPLTGLPNRRAFEERLVALLESARDRGARHALAYLDLDRFKEVNDRYGHEAGDQLLVAVARAMAQSLRPGDLLSRLGGDEFGLLLPDCTVAEAERLVVNLGRRVEECVLPWGETALRVELSAGVVAVDPASSTTELVRRADQACYASKARRKAAGSEQGG